MLGILCNNLGHQRVQFLNKGILTEMDILAVVDIELVIFRLLVGLIIVESP